MSVSFNTLCSGPGHSTWNAKDSQIFDGWIHRICVLNKLKKIMKMEPVQGILFCCYFTKNVTPAKKSGSTLLYSLVNQISIYLLTTNGVPRAIRGTVKVTNEDDELPAQAFTILSGRVTKMFRPSSAHVSSMPAALSENPTRPAPLSPDLGRIPGH